MSLLSFKPARSWLGKRHITSGNDSHHWQSSVTTTQHMSRPAVLPHAELTEALHELKIRPAAGQNPNRSRHSLNSPECDEASPTGDAASTAHRIWQRVPIVGEPDGRGCSAFCPEDRSLTHDSRDRPLSDGAAARPLC